MPCVMPRFNPESLCVCIFTPVMKKEIRMQLCEAREILGPRQRLEQLGALQALRPGPSGEWATGEWRPELRQMPAEAGLWGPQQ